MPESIVQINCVSGSLLSGSSSGAGVVSGEGAGTGDCSAAAGGVITVGGGDGSGEGEGTASGAGGEAGAVTGDVGVQLVARSNSKPKIIPMYLIFMPSVQIISIWIISHNLR